MYKYTGRKTKCPKCKSSQAKLYESQDEWKDLYIVCSDCKLDERR